MFFIQLGQDSVANVGIVWQVQLLCILLWWIAFVLRRFCDNILDVCSFVFLLLQERVVSSRVLQDRNPSSGSTGVSKRRDSTGSHEEESIELYWKDVFENPDHWWDNRLTKKNSRSPDFRHKLTRKALWIDNWFTPDWVRVRFQS